MEAIANIWQTARMTAGGAWNILSILSRGNPGVALVALLAGLGWFLGVGAILSAIAG